MFVLRKKSHILLARYLADQMPSNESLQSHRKAFCFGSILPDIRPSFVTKRHEYFGTFDDIQQKMLGLINNRREYRDGSFWRRAGEVIHYIADYFTFPHNRTFDGTLRQHNAYEKRLKNELKNYVEEGRAGKCAEPAIRFESLDQLLEYIEVHHRRYLDRKRTIEDDICYILKVCYQVFQGLSGLCIKVGC